MSSNKSKYAWDKKELLKRYIKTCGDIIKYFTKKENVNLGELVLDYQNLYDMLFLNKPYFKIPIFSLKHDLKCDEQVVSIELSEFEKESIKKIIDKSLNAPFKIFFSEEANKDSFSNIYEAIVLLKQINEEFSIEVNQSIKNNRFYLDDSKKNLEFCGSTFCVGKDNYYYVSNSKTPATFLTIAHEIMHGIVSKKTNKRFDKCDGIFLYREVGSILIELYGNEHLLKNKLIEYEEYLNIYNDVFLTNIYNDIEIIDFLFDLANSNEKKSLKNIKNLINEQIKKDEDYNFDISELTERPLKHYLIYLYSATIALSIFFQYKNDINKGLNIAIDIMKNVNQENEKEILGKYNIYFEKGIDSYLEFNDILINKHNEKKL